MIFFVEKSQKNDISWVFTERVTYNINILIIKFHNITAFIVYLIKKGNTKNLNNTKCLISSVNKILLKKIFLNANKAKHCSLDCKSFHGKLQINK